MVARACAACLAASHRPWRSQKHIGGASAAATAQLRPEKLIRTERQCNHRRRPALIERPLQRVTSGQAPRRLQPASSSCPFLQQAAVGAHGCCCHHCAASVVPPWHAQVHRFSESSCHTVIGIAVISFCSQAARPSMVPVNEQRFCAWACPCLCAMSWVFCAADSFCPFRHAVRSGWCATFGARTAMHWPPRRSQHRVPLQSLALPLATSAPRFADCLPVGKSCML